MDMIVYIYIYKYSPSPIFLDFLRGTEWTVSKLFVRTSATAGFKALESSFSYRDRAGLFRIVTV